MIIARLFMGLNPRRVTSDISKLDTVLCASKFDPVLFSCSDGFSLQLFCGLVMVHTLMNRRIMSSSVAAITTNETICNESRARSSTF
jgi:hypothetical protein